MATEETCLYSRRKALRTVGALGALGIAGCTGDGGDGDSGSDGDSESDGSDSDGGTSGSTDDGNDSGEDEESLGVAWVTDTPVGDLGWSWAHDQGRQAVEEEFDWVETTIQTEVAPENARRVMDELSRDGYDLIFGCAFGYMDAMIELSEEYPDVVYEHSTGVNLDGDIGIYFGRQYQTRYLVGQAAGLMDDIETIGYVAAFPIPEVIRGINAMTLGARSVDKDITVSVRWTNTWFDPPKETDAAQSLVEADVDMMAQHQDSPAALNTAADNDVWASGYQAPMKEMAGSNYFTSPIWNWENYYVPTVEDVRDGSWEPGFEWPGLEEGVVAVDEFGDEVPNSVVEETRDTRAAIQSGDLEVWADTAFAGQEDWTLYTTMEEFVPGVDGKIPE